MDDRFRFQTILFFFGVGGLILIGSLMRYQLFDRGYRQAAQDRTLTTRTISAPRGIIYDRKGELLVVNEPAYELEMIHREIDPDMDIKAFCELLSIDQEMYKTLMDRATTRSYFRRALPITFLSNIDPEDFARFQEHLHEFPGFYTQLKNKRSYPQPIAAHVLGYISQVSSQDIEKGETYTVGDVKGTKGIERTYEQELRGEKGLEYVIKDNVGREIEAYRQGSLDASASAGTDLTLTIDAGLQAYGESLMRGKRGSVVAIEPSTGEILTMISSPTYDPNSLSFGKQRNSAYLSLLRDTTNKPMLDRSLQAKYPPGSIFKPILSLIALQENITYSRRKILCSGKYVINEKKGFSQGCRNHPMPYNLQIALQHSCNTYFYQMIREFLDQFGYRDPGKGLALLNDYLDAFGIGRPLGVDLEGEIGGFNPPPQHYDDLYNTPEYRWRSTYILSLGIGQGELELTTLQMANLAAIIANRGSYVIPHVLRSFKDVGGTLDRYQERRRVPIDSVHFEPVIDGMERVISAGTGYRAYVPGIEMCGKTGTSQNPFGEDHSVFFAFAPKEDPKVAIAVFVENAGGGGAVAAPIGGLMIEKYLKGEIPKSRLSVQERMKGIDLIDTP
ncbi:MAG: penicillin-binding protein 2 [Bacteroidota bacterium]